MKGKPSQWSAARSARSLCIWRNCRNWRDEEHSSWTESGSPGAFISCKNTEEGRVLGCTKVQVLCGRMTGAVNNPTHGSPAQEQDTSFQPPTSSSLSKQETLLEALKHGWNCFRWLYVSLYQFFSHKNQEAPPSLSLGWKEDPTWNKNRLLALHNDWWHQLTIFSWGWWCVLWWCTCGPDAESWYSQDYADYAICQLERTSHLDIICDVYTSQTTWKAPPNRRKGRESRDRRFQPLQTKALERFRGLMRTKGNWLDSSPS